MSVHWPRNKVVELISLLEEHPLLWDATDANYWKKNKKDAALRMILNELEMPDITVREVKGKINVLRTQYRRELRVIERNKRNESGEDEVKRPSFWCFDMLSFLRPFVSLKEGKSDPEPVELFASPSVQQNVKQSDIYTDNTMHWPRCKISELISLLKEQPLLWDVSDPNHLQKEKKDAALRNILNKLEMPNITVKDVKRKINILRAQYKKELRVIEGSKTNEAGVGAKRPSLWCFKNLNFLQPIASIRESRSSIENEIPLETNKRPKRDEPNTKPAKFRRTVPNQSEQPNHQSDEANTLSATWEILYRKLEPRQQLYANKTIIEVLYQGALGNLNEYSCRAFESEPLDFKSESCRVPSPMTDYESEMTLSEPSPRQEYQEDTLILSDVEDQSS